jgi:hypothetical protein
MGLCFSLLFGGQITCKSMNANEERFCTLPVLQEFRLYIKRLEIKDMRDSEAILSNKGHPARKMIRGGVQPQDGGWKGWLGRYQKAPVDSAFARNRRRRKNAND